MLPRIATLFGALLLVAAPLALLGCQASAGGHSAARSWADGIPLDEPAVVTLENLSCDPPRILGLVGSDHAAAASADAVIRRSGIKRVPADRMDRLLEELTKEGFAGSSEPIEELTAADPKIVLRRLTVTVGDQRRAFTVMRGPKSDVTDRFNAQARAVQAMFNETFDPRYTNANRNSLYFYEAMQALHDVNRRKQQRSGKDGAP